MSAILATSMLVAGMTLGALLGPGPAGGLVDGTRAALVGRVLALMALSAAGESAQLPLSAAATHISPARHGRRAAASASGNLPSRGHSGPDAGPQTAARAQTDAASPHAKQHLPPAAVSPTEEAARKEHSAARLPAIAHVWLIVLPPGGGFASALGQPTTFPYLTGQLVEQGTLLGGYSALAAAQLAGAAALLSGAVGAAASTIEPPCTNVSAGPSSAASCSTGEPAGAQAADAFLQAVVPRILATAAYREGGLIAITFAAPDNSAPASGASTQPGAGQRQAPSAQPAPASGQAQPALYPAGTQTSTLAAAETAGALLLSPFLRHRGARMGSALNSLAPRASLEELLRDTSKTVGR